MTDTAVISENGHADLVLAERALVTSAPVAAVKQQQDDYQALCKALLDETDYQKIGKKQFPKKSAVRKLSVAFNVSCQVLDRSYERDDRNRIIRAEVLVRATAPNGRFMDGLGAADVTEKCCPGSEMCTKSTHYEDSGRPTGHVHCDETCTGERHFSNASHDIPATAHTRATNRACLDLFGMGEVSAEEIGDRGRQHDNHGDSQSQQRQSSSTPKAASEKQIGLIKSLAKERGFSTGSQVAPFINETVGRQTQGWEDLISREASSVIDRLNEMKENGEYAPQEAEVLEEQATFGTTEDPF